MVLCFFRWGIYDGFCFDLFQIFSTNRAKVFFHAENRMGPLSFYTVDLQSNSSFFQAWSCILHSFLHL